jgi:hypothetical protein
MTQIPISVPAPVTTIGAAGTPTAAPSLYSKLLAATGAMAAPELWALMEAAVCSARQQEGSLNYQKRGAPRFCLVPTAWWRLNFQVVLILKPQLYPLAPIFLRLPSEFDSTIHLPIFLALLRGIQSALESAPRVLEALRRGAN